MRKMKGPQCEKGASRRPGRRCFLALTPVALRAPSVSGQKHEQPQKEDFR